MLEEEAQAVKGEVTPEDHRSKTLARTNSIITTIIGMEVAVISKEKIPTKNIQKTKIDIHRVEVV